MGLLNYLSCLFQHNKKALVVLLITSIAFAGVYYDRIDVDNVRIDGNTISITNTDGDLTLDPNGSGGVVFNDLTLSTVPYLDANKALVSSAVTPTELGYLSGVTSSIQTQIDGKLDDYTGSADNAVMRSDGTTGALIQESGLLIDDSDVLSAFQVNLLAENELRFQDSAGGDYIGFKAPTTLSGNQTFTLPDGDGSSGQALVTDGSGVLSWAAAGGGSGAGGINYVSNYKDPTNTTGYATYADAAGVAPVDGTGGSPTLTFTRNTSSPIRDTADFLITKDAADRQGEGVSYDFSIDSADTNKEIYMSFDFAASSSYETDDVLAFVYDVTNSVLMPVVRAGNNSRFTGKFSAGSSTSYRFILHVATTNSAAYTIQLTNLLIGPDKLLQGPVQYTKDFTPTGSWTTNTTYTGTYQRNGSWATIVYNLALAGAPTAANLSFDMPAGLTIDTSKPYNPGIVEIQDTGTRAYPGSLSWNGTVFQVHHAESGNSGIVSETVPFTFANTDTIKATITVPISEWNETSDILSSVETLNGIVRARYTAANASTVPSTSTTFDFDTKDYDSHNAVTTGASWVFTAPKSAYYKVKAELHATGATINAFTSIIRVAAANKIVKGVPQEVAASFTVPSGAEGTVYMLAGQTLDFQHSQATAFGSVYSVSTTGQSIEITEDPDYTVFALNELNMTQDPTKQGNWTCQFEHFNGVTTYNGDFGTMWLRTANGTGGSTVPVAPSGTYDIARFGLLQVRNSTSGGSTAGFSSNASGMILEGQIIRVGAAVRYQTGVPTALEDSTFNFGLVDSGGNDRAIISFDRTISTTNWVTQTTVGGTDYDTDSGVAVSNLTWYNLEVIVDKDNDNAKFYINGVLVHEETTSGEIPASQVGIKLAKTYVAGSSAHDLFVDWTYLCTKPNGTDRGSLAPWFE